METKKEFKNTLFLRKLGIDTYKESVIYMREDCHVCLSEGFETPARVRVTSSDNSIIATLNTVSSDLLKKEEAVLSNYAWYLLGAHEGDEITVSHAKHVKSLSYVRSKIYGNPFKKHEIQEIIQDIAAGRYSDIYLSSFLTACAGDRMNNEELINMTEAMVDVGRRMSWDKQMVVDKHCVGGLPGNRTTPLVVSIVAAYGLTIPKTSSRAITSPSGTADTMEVLAPVELDIETMKKVVEQENGCIVWGGTVSLSPADDIIIGVERALDLDSEAQLVASILSKKIAAGSTHIVMDVPIGPTAKVRSQEMADKIKHYFQTIAQGLGVTLNVVFGDGIQPIGRGIGPALEARDLLAVLQCTQDAPLDLRTRAITLAGKIIEFSPDVQEGEGEKIASEILDSGKAWKKFQAICEAQGGMREIPKAEYTYPYTANKSGTVTAIDNRSISLVAKLAGAPHDKAAGVDLHVSLGSEVEKGVPLFTIHAETPGELHYVLDFLKEEGEIITISEE